MVRKKKRQIQQNTYCMISLIKGTRTDKANLCYHKFSERSPLECITGAFNFANNIPCLELCACYLDVFRLWQLKIQWAVNLYEPFPLLTPYFSHTHTHTHTYTQSKLKTNKKKEVTNEHTHTHTHTSAWTKKCNMPEKKKKIMKFPITFLSVLMHLI